MKRVTIGSILLLLMSVTGLWMAGCDFTNVQEGVNGSTAGHLSALATASDSKSAAKAIRGILNKAQIGMEGQLTHEITLYDGYKLKNGELDALAEAQAAYVRGDASRGKTFLDVYNEVKATQARATEIMIKTPVTPVVQRQIQASITEVLAVFRSEAKSALVAPDDPSSAFRLAIAAEGGKVPGQIHAFDPNHVLSPAQALLFRVWLDKLGPNIHPFMSTGMQQAGFAAKASSDAASVPCDAAVSSLSTTSDNCCGGQGHIVSITLQYLGTESATVRGDIVIPDGHPVDGVFPSQTVEPLELFTIDGSMLDRGNPGFNGDIGNQLNLTVDGTTTAMIHTSCSRPVLPGWIYSQLDDSGNPTLDPIPNAPADTRGFGLFKVITVTTENGGLCSDLLNCVAAAKARLETCLTAAGSDQTKQDACYVEYKENDQNCHDQGTSGP